MTRRRLSCSNMHARLRFTYIMSARMSDDLYYAAHFLAQPARGVGMERHQSRFERSYPVAVLAGAFQATVAQLTEPLFDTIEKH